MSRSRIRRLFQFLVFAAFVAITVSGLGPTGSSPTMSIFSRLDPLVGLATVMASRAAVAFWAAALVTVALTFVFGRAWCGWICPLGTVLETVRLPKLVKRPLTSSLRNGKYVVLALVLCAALLGTLAPMILDPVTIITRPLQELARPFVGSDAVGQSVGADIAWGAVPVVAFLSLVPLLLVVALNLVGQRFWCTNLCPLGGLLALVSKVPGIRRRVSADTCTSCAKCAKGCPTGAISRASGYGSDPAECIVCLQCVDSCKTGSIGFSLSAPHPLAPDFGVSRRDALVTLGATGVGLAVVMLPTTRVEAEILRPPSTTEARLARLCVRCGACYGACPTGVLRPSVSFATQAGPWTPMLEARPVHCTLNCNRCAEPCPTDAIHTPTPAEAAALGLGVKAEVDRNRCRAWARNHACMACQNVCPISGAITGEERPAWLPTPTGDSAVQVPVVNQDLCVGCNQCQSACPVRPQAIGTSLAPDPSALNEVPPWMRELQAQSSARSRIPSSAPKRR